jgi:hypothetical protein
MVDQGRNRVVDHLLGGEVAKAVARTGSAVAGIGSQRLRDTGVAPLVKIADLVHKQTGGVGSDPGFITASQIKRTQVLNGLAGKLTDYSQVDIKAAFNALQLHEKPTDSSQAAIARHIRDVFDYMYDYQKEAGVRLGDLGVGKDYVHDMWDTAKVAANQDKLKAILQRHYDAGDVTSTPDQIIAGLLRNEGSEFGLDRTEDPGRPAAQHAKERILKFLSREDKVPFLEDDPLRVIGNYVTQGSKRAEWARRFGDDNSKLDYLMAQAKEHGATPEQIKTAQSFVAGVNGSLGAAISPKARQLFGAAMVYQNVRLLPLGLFSSIIDPLGVVVRGGTVSDALGTFKRGIAEIPRGFMKNAKDDEGYKLAQDMGTIDNAMLMHILGSSSGTTNLGGISRKVNETFFKLNMMEQFTTSMRVGATVAAAKFLARHADGTASQHSTRWLDELGLKPGDVIVKDGEPLLRRQEFIDHGLSPKAADAAALKMSTAINEWVNGAILRPNASHKAIWMNDPHYALMAHMKQFMFTFQDVTLKRVLHEASYGNYQSGLALAAYVPVMLMADLAKGVLQGGGQQPDWKDKWEASDYMASALQRAGLFGVGQMGIDAFKDLHRGGYGVGSLGGPTIDQLGDVMQTVGGQKQFSNTAIDSMPANPLFKGWMHTGQATTELTTAD